MTVIRSLTFCGTLFSLLVILVALSSQLDFVLGQDESAVSETADSDAAPGPTLILSTSVGSQQEENELIDQGTEADEHCPCVEEKSCPRKYGSDPLDFTTFGHLESCSESGFVRCCGVSVSVVQQTDETVGGAIATVSDIDEYDETATWDLGHAAEQQQEHVSEDTSSKDNSEVSSDNLHEIHQGQLNEDTEKEEGEEEQSSSSSSVDEESKKENDEHQQEEQIVDDNEDDDNVPAESTQNVQTVMLDEPSPPRKRFQPSSNHKFPRYGGRPAENAQENVVPAYDSPSSSSPPPMSSDGNEDSSSSNVSSGNNFRRKTFPSLRTQKVNPTPTSTPDNNGNDGSVVYSQRVSDFSPYRSRNNANRNNNNHNKASVVTATTVDGGAGSDIAEENVETTTASAEASSSLTNGGNPARQRYPQRKRRPFNQMRNRQQQQDEQAEITDSKSLVMDGEEIGAQIKPEEPIYGTSGSGQSSPAPLHVPVEQEEIPAVVETLSAVVDDQLDNNRRRPMSRLVKPRVNGPNNHGRRRMKPAMSDENGDNSLYPNNSYGSAPTTHPTDNENEQQQKQEVLSSQEEESSGPILEDSSADSKATIGSAAAEESEKNGGEVIQSSPTAKLMPLRPKIRSFNRKAPGWSATSNDNADGENSQVNDDESKEVDLSGNTSSSGDLIKPTEQQQHQPPNNGAINIRRIPMRRVQQQQQQPENVPEENVGVGGAGGNDGGNVEPEVPVATVPLVKGRISMRRPINYPGKNNNNVPATAPVQQLSTSIETEAEPNVQPEQVVEKLDVRARLRGRVRPNPLKASSSVQSLPITSQPESLEEDSSNEKTDANSAEVVSQPQPNEPNRSPLLRKRRPLNSRPSILAGQGQRKQQAEEESENYSNNVPAVDASPVTNNVEDHQSGERPRVNIIRKGGPLARLPLQRNHNKPSPAPENIKEDDATLPSPILQEAAAKPTLPRIRQRQNRISSNNRGNSRLPVRGNGGSVDETSASVEAEDANIATSEAPVTVTSTYSRIRTNNNNKNSLLTRPIYRRPSYTTTVPPSIPADQYSSPQTSSTNAIGSTSRFGQRTRFTVPSKSESQTTEQPTPTINSDNDNESEKQGQSSGQLNEQSNNSSPSQQTSISEDSNSGGRKKVGFVRRKMVRGRPKQAEEQQQTEQQMLGENQEKKPEEAAAVVYDQAGNNPEAPDTIHISIQEDADGLNKQQEEQQQQTSSNLPGSADSVDVDDNGNSHNDHVKIVPVTTSGGEDAAENTSHSEKEASGNDDKQGSVDEQEDDESDDTENSSEEADGKYYHNNNAGDAHHAGVSDLVDSDTYDLILNQDVRKTLGTQNSTQHHTKYEEPSSAYQSPHAAPSPDTHLSNRGGGVAGNSNVRNNNYQQQHHHQQQEDYYGSYYDSYNTNTHDVNDHKYSAGVSGGSSSSLASTHYNKESSAEDGIKTLELGTPDYDPNPGVDSSQYYWQGYENLEDEEESRVHMKYLRNKSTPSSSSSSSSSPQSIESGEEHSLSQNESSNNYNGDNINGVGISQSPVNPQQQTPFSNAVPVQSQLSSSTNTDADSDAKRDTNKRIRQKLRRPPSAYIGSSEDSSTNDHVRAPTSAPFTPSLQSPRPTYSGQEALLESVQQSVQTLPPKQENPNSQQLEQFIEQNNKNAAPSRNRSRVRVKLVTLKTTPAPVVNTKYDDDNENYSGTTSDASLSSSTGNSRPSRLPSAKFKFPPFKKSELPLVDTTAPVETESVSSYNPQRVVFRPAASPSTTTTTTTTTTPAPRKPLRNNNYQNNDNGSNYNGINKGSISSSLPGKGRFKVNPSSTEAIKQSASPSSYTSPAPVIRKTQPRIRAPQFHRRLPVTTARTTETPVVIRNQYQVTPTSAPLAYSTNSENQPQQQQQPEPYHHTTSQLDEDDENIISIRITSQDDSSVIDNSIRPPTNENIEVEQPQQHYQNFDTRHQQHQQQQHQQQYLYQLENIVKEKPQLPPPPPPPPAPTPLISNDVTKFNGKKNSGGKGRFKVPEKFELQKPHLLPSSNNNVDSADVRKPYAKPALPAPVSLPAKQQDRYQNQFEPESNGHNLYDNVDVAYHHQQQTSSPQFGQLNNQVVLEEQRRPLPPPQQAEEQEIVPDIRITVASLDQHPTYNVENNEQNYNSNNNNAYLNREPEQQLVIHAVREPQQHEQLSYQQQQQYYRPEQFERDQYNHNQALRNSQYGPFPSTDHWSGIPSSNSPKLPEHFEQKRLPAHQNQPSFEFQNEIRRPSISHELEQQRPSRPMMLPPPPPQQPAPGNDIRFVDSDEEDNRIQYAPVSVNPTVIQFGTEFGTDEVEEEVISKPQRPALPFDHSGSHGLRENEGLSQQRPPINHPTRLSPLPPPPPQSYSHGIPPNENLEYQQRPVGNQEIQFSNNHISPVRSQNEQPQQQPINIHRQPPAPVQVQEPLIQGIPPNSVVVSPASPVNSISIEIKDGELVNAQNVNDDSANDIPHPPPQQQQHIIHFPPPQQQQQQQIIQLPPPQQQQQQHIIQLPLVPPQQLHPQQLIHHQNINMPPPPPGMVIEQNFRPDQRLPVQNSQLPPDHNPNFIVQVDGRPLDTTHTVNQPPVQLLKPLDHHPEREPEIKIMNHPVPLMPPQQQNHPNFPTLNPEGRPVIMPNIRDQQFLSNVGQQHPQLRPQQAPLQHQQPPTQGAPNFGEALMQQGFGEHHPSRPGQYGPPPPGQQRPSQYVPFNAPPKRNESQELSHQQRLPVLPPPPQSFQNPFKFNGGQSQPFPPPQQQQQQHHASRPPPPYRQNFNGNYMSPIPQNQQFNNHHQQRPQQPPPVMMRMPNGIPNGQLGNNPHFPPQQNHHLRPRNSGMRTSRAANLTAEEEKDEREASGRVDTSKQATQEHEEQSQATLDQQEPAILQVPTPQNNIPSDAISQVAPNPESDKREEEVSSSTNGIELPKSVPEVVGQQRQQRELVLNEQQKDDASMSPKSTPLRASMINSENFVQDEIPDESSEPAVERHASQDIPKYSAIPSSPLVEEKEQSQVEDDEYDGKVDDNVDYLTRSKLEKQKKMQEQSVERQHKGKPEMEDGRLVQKSSSESKKSIMKIKSNGKEKSEQLGKGTANKNGKDQQASGENAGDAEIQDFVAPKVIQRGFHPILPYSEQDPGPVVVQMLPKLEKFFPQPTMTTMSSDSSGRAENGPQGVMMMGSGSFHQDPNLLRNNKYASTGNLPAVVMVPTNVLNAQPTVVVNNQAPFRSLLHNHLS